MKWLICLVILISVGACKNDSSEIQDATNDISDVVDTASNLWLDYKGEADMPRIVLVSGDEEYRSEEALPQLAKILNKHHGFHTRVLFAQDPAAPGIVNPNYLHNIPGLESLADADLMIIFTRFRALPDEQMQHIDNYLKTGKPVIGIRTATHAFNFKKMPESKFAHYGNYYEGDDAWKDGFGRLVLGEKWISHHGHHKHQSTVGIPTPEFADYELLNGIKAGDVWGPSDVYGVRLPLPGDSKPVLLGQVTNRAGEYVEDDPLYGMRATDNEVAEFNSADKEKSFNPNDPMMPIAWIKTFKHPDGLTGQAFASTIGSSTDMLSEGVRRMYVNAVYHLLGRDVPAEANVNLVGDYKPTGFAFTKEGFWEEKNISVTSLR